MSLPTLIFFVVAMGLFLYARRRRDGSHRQGLKQAWRTFRFSAPLLVLAFGIVGYATVLIPQEGLQNWIGPDSGLNGLLLAHLLGMLLPGGPYAVFPLVGTLYQLGLGMGPTVTMLTSWGGLSLLHFAWEVRFMGLAFALTRWTVSLFFPVPIGFLAQFLFG